MPLVQLVEHDGRDAGELRVAEETPHEQALGHEPEACARAARLVETDAVADRVADALAPLGRHARGRQAGGQASRLEDPDFARAAEACLEQRGRDAGRLSGAGRGLDHDGTVGLDGRDNFGNGRVDGKRRQAKASARR